jgi:hypothetical protein
MEKEYDFSKGKRGKFYHRTIKINLPVYLDADNLKFVQSVAKKKKLDLNAAVNEILRGDKELAKVLG